nr:unnamed protein product [Spirometra erinaceieuropaei]
MVFGKGRRQNTNESDFWSFHSEDNKPEAIHKAGRWKQFFPFGFWYEFVQTSKLAGPIMLTALAINTICVVSTLFCGRLGRAELAATGLAISVFNVTAIAIIQGLATACDTLFAQTFGGTKKLNMGIQLQRAALSALYIYFSKIYKETFNGYSPEMWKDWNKWYKLAIPGLIMLGLQWWIFEIGTICSGIAGETELAAQSILFNLDAIVFTLVSRHT